MKKFPPGHGWAYLGLLLGLAGSITGNVSNTVLTTSEVPLGLRVPVAIAWPIWTWVAIEVLTRVQWRAHWTHWISRLILMGPTALVAAIVSYLHLYHLLGLAGETPLAQALGPLAIDGTLFGCTVALLLTRKDAQTEGPRRTLAERVGAARATLADLKDAVRVPAVDPIGAVPAPCLSEVPLGPEVPPKADPPPKVPAQTRRTPSVPRGSWNVSKAIQLLLDGGKDQDVADTVGIGKKAIQRTRRALKAIQADPKAVIPTDWKVPEFVVSTIRQEIPRW